MIRKIVPAGPDLVAHIVFTDTSDGDFNVRNPASELERLRRSVVAVPWVWLNQVHGADVVEVNHPGQGAGSHADAAVTTVPGCVLAVNTADCAPVVIVGAGGVGVAHAGWRGIVAGVVPETASRLRHLGVSDPFSAYLGPCIRPANYEFGRAELDMVAAVAGDSVRAISSGGKPALDMGAAVASVVANSLGVPLVDTQLDTSDTDYFSHRTRSDTARQAAVVWLEEVDQT